MPMGGITASSGFPAITVGVSCNTNNGASSATTVVCGPMTPAAGSTIYCEAKYNNTASFTSFADNVNSGSYQPGFSRLRESNHTYAIGSYYKENVANSATTITLTYSSTQTNGQLVCKEIQGVATSYTEDSSLIQGLAGTSTNPAMSSLTPFAADEIVLSGGNISSGTVTAGTSGGTWSLSTSASTLRSQYLIQTTATATTGAFADTTSTAYGIGMSAFAKNNGGSCGITGILDYSGGTNGGTPTAGTINSSMHGMAAQSSQDVAVNNKNGANIDGSGTGLTYSNTVAMPLTTTRNCPFYNGTGSASLSLAKATGSTNTGGVSYYFDTLQPKVSTFGCFQTDDGSGGTGESDSLGITGGDENVGNGDFANFGFGANGTITLEPKQGSGGVATYHWSANTSFGVGLEFNKANDFVVTSWVLLTNSVTFTGTYAAGVAQYQAGDSLVGQGFTTGTYFNAAPLTVTSATATTVTASFPHADASATEAGGLGHYHKMYVYSYAGADCTGSRTLQQTILAGGFVAGGGPADRVYVFSSTNSFATAHNMYASPVVIDILYGSVLHE